MSSGNDKLSEWCYYDYEENGQTFTVTHRKNQTFSIPLQVAGPHELLSRDGRFLVPQNYMYGSHTSFITKKDMYDRQRRLIRYRPGDIGILAYPRSGCTWMEQIVMLLLNNGDPSKLNTKDKNTYNPKYPINNGKILVETMFSTDDSMDLAKPWGSICGQDMRLTNEQLDAIPFRRVFKSHYRSHMLVGMGPALSHLEKRIPPPFTVPGVKFIMVVRDPKDVAVSLIRVNSLNLEEHGLPFTPFVKLFLDGKLYSNDWVAYHEEWFRVAKEHPEYFLILTYEDMIADTYACIKQVADYLEISAADNILEACVKYSTFECMKEMSKKASAEHVHVGKAGAWRKKMTSEMVHAFNKKLHTGNLGKYGPMYTASNVSL